MDQPEFVDASIWSGRRSPAARVVIAMAVWLVLAPVAGRAQGEAQPPVAPLPPPVPELGDVEARRPRCPDAQELRTWFRPLADVALRPKPEGEPLPIDCSDHVFPVRQAAARRSGQLVEKSWTAPELWHKPLYFDDLPLERYGQSTCVLLQPLVSGTRFFLTVPIVPYKMGVNPPHQPVTTLGAARPGQRLPCVRERLPRRFRGALWEAATAVGLVFALP